jgi:hypothetical protein
VKNRALDQLTRREDLMQQRIFRGCRRSLSMWREAIGRYRQPREEEIEERKSESLRRRDRRPVIRRD